MKRTFTREIIDESHEERIAKTGPEQEPVPKIIGVIFTRLHFILFFKKLSKIPKIIVRPKQTRK